MQSIASGYRLSALASQGSPQLAERDRVKATPCASWFLTEGSQLHRAAMPAPVSLCLLAVGRAPGWLGLLLFSSPSILPTRQDVIVWKQHLFPEAPLSPLALWVSVLCYHLHPAWDQTRYQICSMRLKSAFLAAKSTQDRWELGANKEQPSPLGD